MNTELKEIVSIQASRYENKNYKELQDILHKNGESFQVIHKGKKYNFEVEVEYFSKDNIRVRVQGERNTLLGSLNAYAIYFGLTLDGKLIKHSNDLEF